MGDGLDRALDSIDAGRRERLRRLTAGRAYSTPAVSSISMSGIQALQDPAVPMPVESTDPAPSTVSPRPRGWKRRGAPRGSAARTVSRRRLFGLLGGAAAAGAGIAVAGSALQPEQAAAAAGGPLILGAANDAGTQATTVTSNSNLGTFGVQNTLAAPNGGALSAQARLGIAIAATTANNPAVAATSNTAQVRLINNTGAGSGPPSSGGHLGDLYTNNVGELWFCTGSGVPGTWVPLSAPFVPITPARVYDSRPGDVPTNSNPKAPIQSGGAVNVDVTNNSSGVPTSAQAVVGNVTVVNTTGLEGAFLVLYPQGATPPPTSNINWGPGRVVANNFVSQVNSSNGLVTVGCTGGTTDFVIDIFGYYP